MTTPLRFAVSGYYGCGNLGDEAVLAGIRESFIKVGPGTRVEADKSIIETRGRLSTSDKVPSLRRVELIVLSQNPSQTEALHGLQAVDRMSFREVKRTLQASDMLLSGGGSLLQDTTSLKSLLYYLFVARLALGLKKPVMFYAQGLGPLRRPLSRRLVRMAANRAAFLTVRDEPSRALLAEIGVTNPNIAVTADPAFALQPAADSEIDAALRAEGLPEIFAGSRPVIGFALRPWKTAGDGAGNVKAAGQASGTKSDWTELLTETARLTGAHIVLLPMHAYDDLPFADNLLAALPDRANFSVLRSSYTPEVVLGIIGRMDAVAAMRLHTLIFAARMAVPAYALSYDPKVDSLMHGLGLETYLESSTGLDPAATASRIAGMLSAKQEIRRSLQLTEPACEAAALKSAEIALSLF